MRGRRTPTHKPPKTQHSSTTRPKRNNAPTAARQASSTLAALKRQVSALTRELAEAREQQTATAKLLEVISYSASDLQAVFETLAEITGRLSGADRGFVFRFDGEVLQMAAGFNASPGQKDFVARNPIRPGRHSATARAALERRPIHVRMFWPIRNTRTGRRISSGYARFSQSLSSKPTSYWASS